MFGSIIPEPFATQVIVASPTRAESAFGYVSVVMMPCRADERIRLQFGRHAANARLDFLDRQAAGR